MNDLQKIISRAVCDEKFATALQADPSAAMTQAGVDPTPEKVAALGTAVSALAKAHQSFGGSMRPD